MGRSQIAAAALAASLLASAAFLILLQQGFTNIGSVGGLAVLLILFAYDDQRQRSILQSLAFSLVCGFCLLPVSALALQFFLASQGSSLVNPRLSQEWLPLIWVCATAILWGIDRVRMSGRFPSSSQRVLPGLSSARRFTPDFAPPSPTPDISKPQPFSPQPAPAEPLRGTATAPPAQTGPVRVAIPVKPGKETTIFVNLVGEGLNVLRSVQAEHLGKDFYKILGSMPEGESWEYQPGQVVRCQKRNLSSGKGLVAVEEAPRA